jgi:hypothetical protein
LPLLAASAIVLGAGCSSGELSRASIRTRFEQAQSGFDELTRLFESDAEARELREVTVHAVDDCLCGRSTTGSACLSASQWKSYVDRMQRLGVQSVSRQPGSGRTYLVLYYRSFLMDARLRGVVHAESAAGVKERARGEEWQRTDAQWYVFLRIDS